MMPERLQKIIANSGVTSRRKAESLIVGGHVKVNGSIVDQLGSKVETTDSIEIDGEKILSDNQNVYFLLNKPINTISSVDDPRGRKTVVDLIDTDKRIYPVGRLDWDTTGVILLTNDGELTNLLTHPSHQIDKTYVATVENEVSRPQLKKIEEGVSFEGIDYSPAKIESVEYDSQKNTSKIKITIHEGKNHEVKNIFLAIGIVVVKLSRSSFANLNVRDLKPGKYRELTEKEISNLKNVK